MAFEDKDIFAFLDAQGGAFAAVSGGTIVYLSAEARRLFGDRTGAEADRVFDAALLPPSPPGANGTVKLPSGQLPVSSADLGDIRVLTLRPATPEEGRNAVELLAMALRESLTDSDITVGRLGERFRREGDLDGLASLAELRLYHARIARAVGNFERLFGEDIWRPKMRLLSLEALITDLVRSVSLLTRDRGVELRTELAPEERYFYGDGRLLELALVNLLSNALRATPPGGTVTVSLSLTGSNAVIRVTDTGSGTVPGKRGAEFRAHSVPPVLTDAGFGAGLGLGIVQRVAGIHSGAAVIDRARGPGLSVCLVLPYRDAPDESFRAPDSDGTMTLREVMTELSDVLAPSAFIEELQ